MRGAPLGVPTRVLKKVERVGVVAATGRPLL